MNTQIAPGTTASTLLRVARTALATVLVAGGALLPGHAQADESGAVGRVIRLSINSMGSDEFASSHGAISIRHAGNKVETYSWGGTMCPASKLAEGEFAALQSALHNRQRTLVTPRYKSGEVKDVRCLVGFELTAG